MNKWQKFGVAASLLGTTLTIAHVINKLVFSTSVVNGVTDIDTRLSYKWKFGNISYTKYGKGKPVLLIHDLDSMSSTYEWNKVYNKLAKTHTVYCIDLLGCGYSSKPNITYTAYLYVQLLEDFITNVIGKRTDVICTGDSAPITIMSCYNNNSLFDKLILVNPKSPSKSLQIPNKKTNIQRFLLNSPIIGTMIYNICMSKSNIKDIFTTKLFYNTNKASNRIINAYHENAHLDGSCCKYLYTSTQCRYTTASISRALSEIDNSLYIIGGAYESGINTTIGEYKAANAAIEACIIGNCRHLPQLEHPQAFLSQLDIFL